MKTIRLFSVALFWAMLCTSSALFAQLKVGTNPATIGSSSNLEVEASTTGRKVIVDKTSGQVTIADGTQAAGKVLTSDANGATSWQTTAAVAGLGQLRAQIQGFSQGTSSPFNTIFQFATVDYNDIPGATVNTSGLINLPAGTYRVTGNYSVSFVANNVGNQVYMRLDVNSSQYQILAFQNVPNGGVLATLGGSAIVKLTAPGTIWVVGGMSGGACTVTGGGFYSNVSVEKIQ